MRTALYILITFAIYVGGHMGLDWWHGETFYPEPSTYWFGFTYGWFCHVLWSSIKPFA